MKYTKSIDYIKSHPWLRKGFEKLNKSEFQIFEEFFANDHGDKDEAMMACNRMFTDKIDKPKRWATISELVSCVISHHYSNL